MERPSGFQTISIMVLTIRAAKTEKTTELYRSIIHVDFERCIKEVYALTELERKIYSLNI